MSTFFTCLLWACVIGAACAKTEDEFKAWFLELGMSCTKEIPLTSNEIVLMQSLKMPDTENARCFMACFYKKASWMDDKGLYNLDNALELIKSFEVPEKAELGQKVFEACKTVNDESVKDGEKGCGRAGLLYKCLTENALKV